MARVPPFLGPVEASQYGFELPQTRPADHADSYSSATRGACRLQVTRLASIARATGVHRILQVLTPRDVVRLYVSPTGRIRVFDGQGGEWERPR